MNFIEDEDPEVWTAIAEEMGRTLMLALLFSPLLGPVLMLGMQQMGESKAKSEMEKPLSVAIVGAERAPNLVAWLAGQGIARKQVADPDAAIRSQDEDVYIRIEDKYDEHWRKGQPALVEVVSDSTRQDAAIPVSRASDSATGSTVKTRTGTGPSPAISAARPLRSPDASTSTTSRRPAPTPGAARWSMP